MASKFDVIPASEIADLRAKGESWSALEATLSAKYGVEIKSAIPLRKKLAGYLAENGEGKIGPKADKTLVKERDKGAGWGNLAARRGQTVAEVKAAYVKAGGKQPVEGRLYVKADGTVSHRAESTVAR